MLTGFIRLLFQGPQGEPGPPGQQGIPGTQVSELIIYHDIQNKDRMESRHTGMILIGFMDSTHKDDRVYIV